MDRAIRTRWVDALRSGDYAPTTGMLYDEVSDSYCALGVLCAVAEQDGIIRKSRQDDSQYLMYDGHMFRLPQQVAEWAGMDSTNPTVIVNGRRTLVSLLNDRSGLEFKQLADLIEEQL